MRRTWNWRLWIGFLLVLAGAASFPFFLQFPITRDVPWVNLLLYLLGGILLVIGLVRAFRKPELYRGKIIGSVLTLLTLLIYGSFAFSLLYAARQIPAAKGAPQVGQKAPDFALPDQSGKQVALSDLLSQGKGALLIFYRGHW